MYDPSTSLPIEVPYLHLCKAKRELNATSSSLEDVLDVFELIYEYDNRTGLLKPVHEWYIDVDTAGVKMSPWLGSHVSGLNFRLVLIVSPRVRTLASPRIL